MEHNTTKPYTPIFKGNQDFIIHYTSQNCLTQNHKHLSNKCAYNIHRSKFNSPGVKCLAASQFVTNHKSAQSNHRINYPMLSFSIVCKSATWQTIPCRLYFSSFTKWVLLPHALQTGVELPLMPRKKWVASSNTKTRLNTHSTYYSNWRKWFCILFLYASLHFLMHNTMYWPMIKLCNTIYRGS